MPIGQNRSVVYTPLKDHIPDQSFPETILSERIYRSIKDGVSLDIVPLAYAFDDSDSENPESGGAIDPDCEVRLSRLDRIESQIVGKMAVEYDSLQKRRQFEEKASNNENISNDPHVPGPVADPVSVQS